jgi:hypothetical protein
MGIGNIIFLVPAMGQKKKEKTEVKTKQQTKPKQEKEEHNDQTESK